MLSELMFASVSTERKPRSDRAPGISMSGFYPCAYRMYLAHTEKLYKDDTLTPQMVYNMDDGRTHEAQVVERLKQASIIVWGREFPDNLVYVGQSRTSGRPDGFITLNKEDYLWEFKAMNTNRFLDFSRFGLKVFPNYKAQVQGYMLGKGLKKCIFQAKHKDSNDYCDFIEYLDEPYITQIVDWVDRIKIEGWVPTPVKAKECLHCGVDCFGKPVDMSWIKKADAHEQVEKWKDGYKYSKVGELMMEEAKAFFCGVKDKQGNLVQKGLIGDGEVLLVEDLKIQKSTQHRWGINKELILKEIGQDGLLRVSEEKIIESYRIREVS